MFALKIDNDLFQSTLPHGSDILLHPVILTISYFNPRSLTGATVIGANADKFDTISIHAPSRERRCTARL